jgi:hypothetical protein
LGQRNGFDKRREEAGRERVVLARGLFCCEDDALAEGSDEWDDAD